MKYINIFMIVCCTQFALYGQPINKSSIEDIQITADKLFEKRDYYNALEWYEKLYEENRDLDVAYKIAKIHESLRDYRKAERWWKKIANKRSTRKNPNSYIPNAIFSYARMLKMNGNYIDAKEQFRLFISESEDAEWVAQAKRELKGCEMGQKMEKAAGVEVKNLGGIINTKYSEYSPQLVNGNELYFTAIQADKVIVVKDMKEDFHSKAFLAIKKGKGKWGKPKALGNTINREGFHIGNVSLSSDRNRIYFTRTLLDGSNLIESKIYYSDKSDGDWGPANELENVNGDYLVKQPVVGELFGNEVLFFISDMQGGEGGFDIYYSTKKGDTYDTPIGLGKEINTKGNEATPYYTDGILYFSSDRHIGLGGYDIFSSEWNGTNWSKPANLGKGYNSPQDDLYFSIDTEGLNGLLVSNREGTRSAHGKTCCNDIWSFEKEALRLDFLAKVFDEKNQPLNQAKVVLTKTTDNSKSKKNSKDDSDKFKFSLEKNMQYTAIASLDGYYPDTVLLTTNGIKTNTIIEENFFLKPIPKVIESKPEPKLEYETFTIDQPIELENIFYDLDDDKILLSAEKDLNIILELMNQYQDLVIELSSHTDAQGGTNYNKMLSQRRADSAKNWLISRGVATNRIIAMGYGESQIRNQCANGVNCSDEDHRYNRRTEFKIISGPKTIQIEKTRLKKN